AAPADDPRMTMRGSVPPPAKPDSVELLRKRTGTPRVGVPINPPDGTQAPVAGVIEPAAAAPGKPRPSSEPAASQARPPSQPSVQSSIKPSSSDAGRSTGKRPSSSSADLRLSDGWYDEGDQLSGHDDTASVRNQRARKLIAPSATDLSFEEER